MTTIRALQPDDDRSRFASGDDDLDRFLRRYAGQNQFRHHLGTTYVVVDDQAAILGYATVSAGSVVIDALPESTTKKLPDYPLPVLRLARLAVDSAAQGQGLGRALVRFVLELAIEMQAKVGCVGVVVDAKPDAVAFYEAHGFIALDLVEGQSAARPMPTAMFLSLKDVVAAKNRRK